MYEGYVEKVTPVSWHSSKIERVSRSARAAEARAVVTREDYLFHARYQFGEFFEAEPNVFDVDSTIITGCLVV